MARGDSLVFDLDDEDLKLFNEEADEQLEMLDTSLVALESDSDPELVQRIFRAAHTLKGSSATIGHKRMASLTHAMETVLDAVRQGKASPTGAMIDALLRGLDTLRELAGEVLTRIDSGAETADIETELLGLLDASGNRAAPKAIAKAALVATQEMLEAADAPVYMVSVTVEPACALPSIRCFQVLQELDGCGEVMDVRPGRDVIESGGGEFELSAIIATTTSIDELKKKIASVSDLLPAQVTPAGAPVAEAPAATKKPALSIVPDEAAVAKAAPQAGNAAARANASIRIDVERLDGLMNLVGELVIDRTRLQRLQKQLKPMLKDANQVELGQNFEEITSHLTRVTDELQEQIMRSRMLPIRSVFSRLPRVVRDVAAKGGKRVELVMEGEATELDRSVIEELADPLIHILRNAVDHGIEPAEERIAAGKPENGTVTITAWNQETYIYVSVKDDGKGIDTAALRRKAIDRGMVERGLAEIASDETVLRYVFLAGLSTAKTVSDVSGRGVGMDIVRANIERLNGQVHVKSVRGEGSEFIIQLPLTLATTKALMVMANETVYAMPLVSVTEAIKEGDADIHAVGGHQTLRLRDSLMPLVELSQAVGAGKSSAELGKRFVVAGRHSDRQVAFIVDRLLGEQDVVVKSLGSVVGNRKGLTGATILGDGTLGLIIDTASLIAEQRHTAAI